MLKKKALVFVFMCSPQFAFSSSGYVWEQIGLDINGEAQGEESGYSVSLSNDGKILAVGAHKSTGDDGSGGTLLNSGHVKVYRWSGSNWGQIGQTIDGEGANDYSGYSVSLDNSGTILAIGAHGNDGEKGHIRLYSYNGSSWVQTGDLAGDAALDRMGRASLSSDGNKVAIGAPYHDNEKGHVKVYQWSGSDWGKIGSDIDGENEYDRSGEAISLSSDGSILAVGAYYNDGASGSPTDNRGHVKIYEYDGSNWQGIGEIDGEEFEDESGIRVALSSDGTILAVSAKRHDGANGTDSGHVKVYQYDGSDWEVIGDIDGDAMGDNDDIETAEVALSSDGMILAIGARMHDREGEGSDDNSGHVKVYQYDGSDWKVIGDIDGVNEGDKSGYVALSGDGTILAVGAPLHDLEGEGSDDNRGHVKIYKLKSPGKTLEDLEQLQDESISQIGFSFGQFSGISAVPFTSICSAKSFTVCDNLANPISVQLEYKPRIMIRNSNDLKSLEGSASMNFTQNLAMGVDLGIIKKHSGAAVQSAAQIDNHIIKVGVNSYYLSDAQSKRYYQVGVSLNSGKMNLSRQGVVLGTESGHGIADVSILSAIAGYHTNLTNWSLPEYQVDLIGKLSRVTRDAYNEENDIVNALSYEKFDRDELDLNLSVSRSNRLNEKVHLTLGSAIQGTLVLHQSDATMTEQANTNNTWTISPSIENKARASVYASLGYKVSDSLWVNLNLSAQRDAFNKHNTGYLSVSVSF